jgi:hypothetical protein
MAGLMKPAKTNLLSSYAYSVLSSFKVLKKQLQLRSQHGLQQRKGRVYSKAQPFEAAKTFSVRRNRYFLTSLNNEFKRFFSVN